MEALHDLDHILRRWLVAMRLSTGRAVGTAHAQARPVKRWAGPPSLPPMSLEWRMEHDIASSKHQEDR